MLILTAQLIVFIYIEKFIADENEDKKITDFESTLYNVVSFTKFKVVN